MRPRFTQQRILAAFILAAGLLVHIPAAVSLETKAISFVFNDIDGKPIRLADYRGKWVLVSFWAPWCPLCKHQTPALNKLDERPDFKVIGVGLDYDTPRDLQKKADSFDMDFTIVAGGKRRDPQSPHRQIGPVDFFPTNYLYDPNGEIVMYIPGQTSTDKVLAFMDRWQAGPALASAPARTDRLAAFVQKQYGQSGASTYAEWRQMVDGAADVATREKLARTNDYFNRIIRVASDQSTWGKPKYWATLGEVLGKKAGDSEDFAIAKYFTLLALDIPAERLRMVYVKSRDGKPNPMHMVLAYFETPDQEPLLLDNRQPDIQPASLRPDLKPIYSFNNAGAWGDARTLSDINSEGRLPMWEDTLRRARNQGF
jgi:predicted transglutaminase-like cysteine proteinase/thiol-disulfide isomerase/thioredoxin